jgi:hypothetical protein
VPAAATGNWAKHSENLSSLLLLSSYYILISSLLKVGAPFNPEDPHLDLRGDPKQPYRIVYEALRERVGLHWESGREPILGLYVKPLGAYD